MRTNIQVTFWGMLVNSNVWSASASSQSTVMSIVWLVFALALFAYSVFERK